MKISLGIACISLVIATVPVHAGLFKNSVDLADLADLAEVAEDRLTTRKDSEFDTFLDEVRLNAAKAAERSAAGGVKAAKRILEAETLDHKAAEAEVKAAKANSDAERMTIADTKVKAAEQDLKTTKLLLKWKERERDMRELEVRRAKSGLDLAEARRDLSRARLLTEAGLAAADKYDPSDLEKSVSKRQKELEAATRKAETESANVGKLKLEWERVVRNPAPPEDD